MIQPATPDRPAGPAPDPGHFDQPVDRPRGPAGAGDLPDGISPIGVPTERSGRNAFVLSAAAVVALLALIFTLSWVVYHHLDSDDGGRPRESRPTQPIEPTVT
jgi:hypothetical protein